MPKGGEFRVDHPEEKEVIGISKKTEPAIGTKGAVRIKKGDTIIGESDNRVLNPKISLMFSEDITRASRSDIFLSLEYTSKDKQRGTWLLKEYSEHKLALTTALLGRDDTPLHRILGEGRVNNSIRITLGIAIHTLGNEGLLELADQTDDPKTANILREIANELL